MFALFLVKKNRSSYELMLSVSSEVGRVESGKAPAHDKTPLKIINAFNYFIIIHSVKPTSERAATHFEQSQFGAACDRDGKRAGRFATFVESELT